MQRHRDVGSHTGQGAEGLLPITEKRRMAMFDERTLLSLILIERLAGPRAAKRSLLLFAWLAVAPALLLGVGLFGTLAWQWGTRAWDDLAHRARSVAPGPAPATDAQTQVALLRQRQAAADEALPRRSAAVREALL